MASRTLALLLTTLVACHKNDPDPIVVYAAASTADALQEIGDTYHRRTGHEVRFSFGGSSELARQIEAGAKVDVFLSADVRQMDALETAGKLAPASRVELVSNTLVVVVPLSSSRTITQPADLASIGKIATGAPDTVPIGIYAKTWLEKAGVWDAVKPNIVATLDVRAALAAVESESVPAAIVYRTDALISQKVRIVFEVPRADGPKIVYPLALVAGARQPLATAFYDELRSDAARGVFERHGFVTP